MSEYEKEVLQAILIADNNVEHFRPLTDTTSAALVPIVNVAMLDYALEALNQSGIEEVFIYSSQFLGKVRDHVKHGIASLSSWSINMKVNVIGGEGSRCFGDAMRDLDAKGLIRGNFIILGADTIMNANLRPIFEQHKKTVKYDKGTAATLIFKEASSHIRTGNEVMIAVDKMNNRLHHHQRLKLSSKEPEFNIPLEIFMINSQVELYHNLIDPQIAIGSPSMLSLFSDNFDFETRDDFIRGILINEEILDARIYVALLGREQYARKVNNWLSYQIISQDIMNRWSYPLVPDMGIHGLSQQYIYWKNNIYKSPNAAVAKSALHENVVIQAGTVIKLGTNLENSVVGGNCKIEQNCKLANAYVMDDVQIDENCILNYCVIGQFAKIGANCELTEGTVIAPHSVIPANTKLSKALVKAFNKGDDVFDDEDEIIQTLGEKAFVINDKQHRRITGKTSMTVDSDDEDDADWLPIVQGIPKMHKLPIAYEESEYTSSDEDDMDGIGSQLESPLPDDTNIFLSEVMDSLTRGYQDKSNPDFLILEINSSRYAYNMTLAEVNFNVVKAIFSLQWIQEPSNGNILIAINNVLKQLGPVMSNYIKTESAMLECLNAIEDVYAENKYIREKISQILHYLYEKDFLSEDAILSWYDDLDKETNDALCKSLTKLIDWLNQSSEEESETDDDASD